MTALSLAGKFKIVYEGEEVSASRTWGTVQTSRIFIDNRDHGEFAKWEVVPTGKKDSEWHIRNVGAGDYVCGQPSADTRIIGKEEHEVAWCIEQPIEGNKYRVRYPSKDLYWTAIQSVSQIPGRKAWEIFLKSGDGYAAEQLFGFVGVV